MATLLKRKSKKSGKTLYTVQVVLNRRRRTCVPLGDVTKAQALEAKGYIERLASSRRGNLTIPATTAEWLREVDDDFYAVLVDRGLCEPRQAPKPDPVPQQPTLGEFLNTYRARRTDVKPATLVVWGHTC